MSLAESQTSGDAHDQGRSFEPLLHEFDEAWATAESPPAIDDFVSAANLESSPERWKFIEELIKIDLEYRWRSQQIPAVDPWTLNDYAAQLQLSEPFPSNDLIGEEYWVRQLWGDCPSHAEFLDRYVRRGEALGRKLVKLDTELARQSPINGMRGKPGGDTPRSLTAFDTRPRSEELGPAPVVPGYKLLDVLDHGGMAVVYRARQLSLNRVVALKVIRGGEHARPKELERFRAEIEAVASLRHPNIVQVFEAGQWNGMPYCAMELVPGGSLAQKLVGVPLQANPAARLTTKLARALHATHVAGIVHRDLKPANVLLEPSQHRDGIEFPMETGGQRFEPKVADFGLAKRLGDSTLHTATGELLGTPSYMAPEQAVGSHAAIGPHTDVYALGVLLYEMLTGRPPFRATSALETLRQVIRGEPVPPSRLQTAVPRDLETICLKCLERNPQRRFATADELASDLERFVANVPIHARRAGLFERGAKWSRRNPAWAAAIAITVLASIGFIAGTVHHNRQLQVEIRRANESTAEAKRQKSQALANFNQMHETLLGMLNRLWQESQLSGDESLRELRKNLLQSMLRYYDEVSLEHADTDPDIRLTKALVEFDAAHVHHYLEQYDQAELGFRRALPTLEELATTHPGNRGYRRWWALCCYRLALTASINDETEEVAELLHKALEILGPALANDPTMMSLAGRCRTDLAQLSFRNNETEQAISNASQAVALWRSVVDAEPVNDEHRSNFCIALNQLARITALQRKLGEAEAIVAECASVTAHWNESVNTYYPISSRCDLADSYRVLGLTAVEAHQFNTAKVHFAQAIELLDQVLSQSRDFGLARNALHGTYWGRAKMYELLGREHDAIKDWDLSVEYGDGSLRHAAWIGRIHCRFRLGDHHRAIADADELLAESELPGETLFELAGVYCQCAVTAMENESSKLAEHNAEADDLAVRAVKCLEGSRAAGFFDDPVHRRDLQTRPLLSILHMRADFQKLLEDVTVASVEK